MARIDSGEVTMRPLALTSVTRRGARREQQEGATVADAGPPAPANDPHANTQLAQSLPRRLVREARLRAPGTPRGVPLVNLGRTMAHLGAVGAAVWGGFAAIQAPAAAAYGYFNDDLYYKNLAVVSGYQAVGALAAFLGMGLADVLAARYVEAQTRWYEVPTKAQRASELGATEACLDQAVDMVTIFDADHPGPAMDGGEQLVLATDLLHLMTVERSRLPPELWQAASGVGDDAHRLVTQLLQAARARAADEASTSSAD
ncbi:type III secretion system effector XopAV [Xanthomonas euvesicatoria pv. eucalypti]|uniref:type III secretion system effector XopAV n=1 Tax=Xanthomonas euvesicatoria TaxID=456327 RepID=UPI0026E24674|nr:type III secretion system effector XopAV [Xanthomonas euvesicatoria]MDO7951001.1 type III secretion system effector XopAV [Xanthomonas euvesicatoria pv. eucalypti]MDO7959101.1 type III secretion system effector XopAV [Xanthomonas euvesicatoria pv. eucalypti]